MNSAAGKATLSAAALAEKVDNALRTAFEVDRNAGATPVFDKDARFLAVHARRTRDWDPGPLVRGVRRERTYLAARTCEERKDKARFHLKEEVRVAA